MHTPCISYSGHLTLLSRIYRNENMLLWSEFDPLRQDWSSLWHVPCMQRGTKCGGLGKLCVVQEHGELVSWSTTFPLIYLKFGIFGTFVVLNSRITGHPVAHLKAVLLEFDRNDGTPCKENSLCNRNKPVNFLFFSLSEFLINDFGVFFHIVFKFPTCPRK